MALEELTSGAYNVAIGHRAGGMQTMTSNNNIAIGCCAALNVSSGACNIAIGEGAMRQGTTTGNRNVALGTNSGCKVTSGGGNVFLGNEAGRYTTTANSSVAIGEYAGQQDDDGGYHTFLGYGAGRCMQGDSNVAIGRLAGRGSSSAASNTGSDNISIGMYAGCELTSGNQNILIGRDAGNGITSGNKNVVIGYDVEPASATGSAQMAIGCGGSCWISGDSSMNVTVGGTLTATSFASSGNGMRKITTSTSAPSGGADGDIWIKYTA